MVEALEVRRGSAMRFLISRPEGTRPAKGWPVLCFLHGYDEAAPTDIRKALTRHGPLSPSAAAAARERFLIVAPQLPVGGDLWFQQADEVVEIVRTTVNEEGGDSGRVCLTGFSFGGNGVLDLAVQHPESWVALWPVDPTRVTADPRLPIWLSVGEIARRRSGVFTRVLGLEPPGDSPGDRVILDQGDDHVGAARRAWADPRIYEWIESRRVKDEE